MVRTYQSMHWSTNLVTKAVLFRTWIFPAWWAVRIRVRQWFKGLCSADVLRPCLILAADADGWVLLWSKHVVLRLFGLGLTSQEILDGLTSLQACMPVRPCTTTPGVWIIRFKHKPQAIEAFLKNAIQGTAQDGKHCDFCAATLSTQLDRGSMTVRLQLQCCAGWTHHQFFK